MWDDRGFKPIPKAHLCDRCRYVTFNDPGEDGKFLCNVCKRQDGEWAPDDL